MKLNSLILAASLIATMTAVSISANAASDMDKAAEMKAAPPTAQTEKASATQRHSHMQEKTGVPQKAPEAAAARRNAWKDTSKHFHPRDGK